MIAMQIACPEVKVLQALDTKQGDSQNFATLKERDEYIKREMKLKEDSRQKLKEQIRALQASIVNIEESRRELMQVSFPICQSALRYQRSTLHAVDTYLSASHMTTFFTGVHPMAEVL